MLTDRKQLYKTVTVDGIREIDVLDSALPATTFTSSITVQVTQGLIGRPDLISYKMYGTVDLWWLILHANDIIDPIEDMHIGQTLNIPSINEFYSFYDANQR